MSYFRNTMTTSLLSMLLVGCFVLSPAKATYAAADEQAAAEHEQPVAGENHDDKADAHIETCTQCRFQAGMALLLARPAG